MAYCKKFIILFLILFLLLFNFSFCFATEESNDESVSYNLVSGIQSTTNSNFFVSNSQITQGYVQLEKGYIYTFHCTNSGGATFCFCNEIPALNVPYSNYTYVQNNRDYTFVVDNSFTYLVFSVNSPNDNKILTRTRIPGQTTAIDNLVENVGPNALWGVFGSGIDFVFIIVIVAFGLFIVYKLIKGLSKGKSKI